MSSLSRRACFKCGNIGHYAEVCSSSERLCYNCQSRQNAHHTPILTGRRQAAWPRVEWMPPSSHHREYVTSLREKPQYTR